MSALSGVPRLSAKQLATRPKWTVAKLILSQRQSGRLLLFSRTCDINSKQVAQFYQMPGRDTSDPRSFFRTKDGCQKTKDLGQRTDDRGQRTPSTSVLCLSSSVLPSSVLCLLSSVLPTFPIHPNEWPPSQTSDWPVIQRAAGNFSATARPIPPAAPVTTVQLSIASPYSPTT